MSYSAFCKLRVDAINFLKSLRPQPKQEWSEEDEQKLNRIYDILGYAADDKGFLTSKRIIGDKEAIELQDFLKSLRTQPQGVYKQIVHNILYMIDRYESLGYDVTSNKTCIPQILAMCKTADECHEILDEPHWKPKHCWEQMEWADTDLEEFTENVRHIIIDKLTTVGKDANGSKISSTVAIDDKTAKEIANAIIFCIGSYPQWKPSEMQMRALEKAIIKVHSADEIPILTELREQLKKLM